MDCCGFWEDLGDPTELVELEPWVLSEAGSIQVRKDKLVRKRALAPWSTAFESVQLIARAWVAKPRTGPPSNLVIPAYSARASVRSAVRTCAL